MYVCMLAVSSIPTLPSHTLKDCFTSSAERMSTAVLPPLYLLSLFLWWPKQQMTLRLSHMYSPHPMCVCVCLSHVCSFCVCVLCLSCMCSPCLSHMCAFSVFYLSDVFLFCECLSYSVLCLSHMCSFSGVCVCVFLMCLFSVCDCLTYVHSLSLSPLFPSSSSPIPFSVLAP